MCLPHRESERWLGFLYTPCIFFNVCGRTLTTRLSPSWLALISAQWFYFNASSAIHRNTQSDGNRSQHGRKRDLPVFTMYTMVADCLAQGLSHTTQVNNHGRYFACRPSHFFISVGGCHCKLSRYQLFQIILLFSSRGDDQAMNHLATTSYFAHHEYIVWCVKSNLCVATQEIAIILHFIYCWQTFLLWTT